MVPLGKKEALCEVIESFPDDYRKSNGDIVFFAVG